jgi:hypothetical protein
MEVHKRAVAGHPGSGHRGETRWGGVLRVYTTSVNKVYAKSGGCSNGDW